MVSQVFHGLVSSAGGWLPGEIGTGQDEGAFRSLQRGQDHGMAGHSQTNGLVGYNCLPDALRKLVQLAVWVIGGQDQCEGPRPTSSGEPVSDGGKVWSVFHGFQGVLDGQGKRVSGGPSLALNEPLYRIGLPSCSCKTVNRFSWEKNQLPRVHGRHRAPHDIVRVVRFSQVNDNRSHLGYFA